MLVKALMEWLASLWYEMVEYLLDQLMELFNVNLAYFAERVPVVREIGTIFIAVGWALLIGNLAYQATRSMVSGIGIEAEDPERLFLRTGMFSFLLLASRQICEIGFGLSSSVMELLQVPDAVTFSPFDADYFDMLPNAGWLIVIIVNIVIQWQLIKLFFEVAERYVILCILTYCAPLAFAMGGAKSTAEIFRGWLRMFASMCALMVFNLMFVKLVLSALSTSPNGFAVIPWAMLVIGIVRVAKKMDGIILRIGMNPALTGDPLGSRIPGMLTMTAIRAMTGMVTQTIAKGAPPDAARGKAGGTANKVHTVGASDAIKNNVGRMGDEQRTETQRAGASSAVQSDGAQAHGQREPIQQRCGADDEAAMRRKRNAISIDADDFADGDIISATANMNTRGTSPVPPPLRPVSADFAQTSPPPVEERRPRPAASPTPRSSHSFADSIKGGSFTPRSPERTDGKIGVQPRTEAASPPAMPMNITDTAGGSGGTGQVPKVASSGSVVRPAASPAPPSRDMAPILIEPAADTPVQATQDANAGVQILSGVDPQNTRLPTRPAASPVPPAASAHRATDKLLKAESHSGSYRPPPSPVGSAAYTEPRPETARAAHTTAPQKSVGDATRPVSARPAASPATPSQVETQTSPVKKTPVSPDVSPLGSHRPPASPVAHTTTAVEAEPREDKRRRAKRSQQTPTIPSALDARPSLPVPPVHAVEPSKPDQRPRTPQPRTLRRSAQPLKPSEANEEGGIDRGKRRKK